MRDNLRPHRYPASMVGPDAPEDVLGWKCAACSEWISEWKEYTVCPIDWRAHLCDGSSGEAT